jgi:hypothetical protein
VTPSNERVSQTVDSKIPIKISPVLGGCSLVSVARFARSIHRLIGRETRPIAWLTSEKYKTTPMLASPPIGCCASLKALDEGVVTSVELIHRCLRAIEQQPTVFDCVSPHALDDAVRCDDERKQGKILGPLHGITVSVKSLIGVQGLPCSYGSPSLSHYIPQSDSVIVTRMKQAGAIIIGLTKMSEFGLSYHTQHIVNPRNALVSAGGSSGGEGVASVLNMRSIGVGGVSIVFVYHLVIHLTILGSWWWYSNRGILLWLYWTATHCWSRSAGGCW